MNARGQSSGSCTHCYDAILSSDYDTSTNDQFSTGVKYLGWLEKMAKSVRTLAT